MRLAKVPHLGVVMTDTKTSQFNSDEGPDEHRDLERLGKKIRKVRGKDITTEEPDLDREDSLPSNGLGVAMRIGIELVVSVFVGTGIGWGLDQWLGTKPWLMVVFFMLGTAAGFFNVIRMATTNADMIGGDDNSPPET
jgi:ATP synthase protein I